MKYEYVAVRSILKWNSESIECLMNLQERLRERLRKINSITGRTSEEQEENDKERGRRRTRQKRKLKDLREQLGRY